MALFSETKEEYKTIRENLIFLRKNKLKKEKTRKSIDDIKEAIYFYDNEYISFIRKIGHNPTEKQTKTINGNNTKQID